MKEVVRIHLIVLAVLMLSSCNSNQTVGMDESQSNSNSENQEVALKGRSLNMLNTQNSLQAVSNKRPNSAQNTPTIERKSKNLIDNRLTAAIMMPENRSKVWLSIYLVALASVLTWGIAVKIM